MQDRNEPPATVPNPTLEIPPAPRSENTSAKTTLLSPDADAGQRELHPRSALLAITLFEGVGISIPEHHKHLWQNYRPQEPGHILELVAPVAGNSLDVLDRSGSLGDNPAPKLGPPKKYENSGVYAIMECEKVQVPWYVSWSSVDVENPIWTARTYIHTNKYKFDIRPSEPVEVSIHLYVKNPLSVREHGRAHDIYLGVARYRHEIENRHSDETNPWVTNSSIKWLDIEKGTGKVRVGVKYMGGSASTQPLCMDDFEMEQRIGATKSVNTFRVRKRDGSRLYALKEISKSRLRSSPPAGADETGLVETIRLRALSMTDNPFVVPIKFAFQSPENIYLVAPFILGGGLMQRLHDELCIDIQRITHYAAEIVCGLEYLHDVGIFYGHLNARNIALDLSGHICICDFALPLSQLSMATKKDRERVCATEIITGLAEGRECIPTANSDWWTLGILLADMLSCFAPHWYRWREKFLTAIHTTTESQPIVFPATIPAPAQDLCIKLLHRDPEQRLGAKGVAEIKNHSFFEGIDWDMVLKHEYEPAFLPEDHSQHQRTGCEFGLPMTEEDRQKMAKMSESMMEESRIMFADWYYQPTRPPPVEVERVPSNSMWFLTCRKRSDEGSSLKDAAGEFSAKEV